MRRSARPMLGITDFRAKLLALLPIASGAGIGFLFAQASGSVSSTEAGLLIALGTFGVVITAGLFLYELRQIDHCKQLENHASWIERGAWDRRRPVRRPTAAPEPTRGLHAKCSQPPRQGSEREREYRRVEADVETRGRSPRQAICRSGGSRVCCLPRGHHWVAAACHVRPCEAGLTAVPTRS